MLKGILSKCTQKGGRIPTDLALAICWALMSALCVLILPENNPIRAIMAFPFVLVVPGYMIVSLIWPGTVTHERRAPGLAERLILSLGLSIVIVSLLGMTIDAVSMRIALKSITLSLTAAVLALGIWAMYARKKLPDDERFKVEFNSCPLRLGDKSQFAMATLAIALLVVTAALFAFPPSRQHYTNFYLMDESGSFTNLTNNVDISEPANFTVGIECNEKVPVEYWFNVTLTDASGNYIEMLISENHTFEREGVLEIPLSFKNDVPGTYRLMLRLTNKSTGIAQNVDWTIKVG